jgi:hypothetical protein
MCRTGTTESQAHSRLTGWCPCLREDINCIINDTQLCHSGGFRSWWGSGPDDRNKQPNLSCLLRQATWLGI